MIKNKKIIFALLSLFVLLHLPARNHFPDSTTVSRKFFCSYGTSMLTEFITSKALPIYKVYIAGQQPNGNFILDSVKSYQHASGITIMAMTFEPRWNLKDFSERSSVSLSVPIEVSFNFIDLSARIGTIVVPVIADYNSGMHSTFNNIDRYGFHAGFGYQLIVAGIKKFGTESSMGTLIWTQPVGRAGVKFPIHSKESKTGTGNCFIDLYCGLGWKYKYVNSIDSTTGIASYNESYSRFYAKIVFGWLINY